MVRTTLLTALLGCAGVNNVGMAAAASATLCDYGETRFEAGHAAPRSHDEANPYLGSHPGVNSVDTYFAGVIAMSAIAYTILPPVLKPLVWVPLLLTEAQVSVANTRYVPMCGVQ